MTLRVREEHENRAIDALPYSSGDFRRKVGHFSEFGRIFRLTFSGLVQANSTIKNSNIRDEN